VLPPTRGISPVRAPKDKESRKVIAGEGDGTCIVSDSGSGMLTRIRGIALRDFDTLSQKEILALAISLEEEDERIYSDFGESLRGSFPGTAQVFEGMRQDEIGHRRRLIELYQQKFGEHIPLIRRQDGRGFVQRKPIWLNTPLRLEQIRAQVSAMEVETRRFYEQAAARAQDASVRQLLDDLAAEEAVHVERAADLEKTELPPAVREEEDKAKRRLFVLQIVQPGLQNGAFRRVGGISVHTTYLTGMITSLIASEAEKYASEPPPVKAPDPKQAVSAASGTLCAGCWDGSSHGLSF